MNYFESVAMGCADFLQVGWMSGTGSACSKDSRVSTESAQTAVGQGDFTSDEEVVGELMNDGVYRESRS